MEDADLRVVGSRKSFRRAVASAPEEGGPATRPSTPDSGEELDWSWLEEVSDKEEEEQEEEGMGDPPPFRASMRRIRPLSSRLRREEEEGEAATTEEEPHEEETRGNEQEGWPHTLSCTFACLSCTLGLFNISRFALLSVHFGGNFIIQFIILSLLFGLPLYTFHVSIGRYLGAGVIDMWKISPVFQGIGIALLASQAFLGIYNIVGVSWMFVYLRDSFITSNDLFRWAQPLDSPREANSPVAFNGTYKIEETVPDYFSGIVLQRHNLSTFESHFGRFKFHLVFNLAVIWMIVFVCLCKGLKSYGKVVYVFMPLGLIGISVLSVKMIGITPSWYTFHETVWSEFFLNSKSWVAAATEAFFTWGLLGACAMQITSHNTDSGSKKPSMLHRDAILVATLTMISLVLSALLANACVRLLFTRGNYEYIPSSFEKMSSYGFLWPLASPTPEDAVAASRYMTHVPLAMGVQVAIPLGPIHFGWTQSGELELVGDAAPSARSGYQALRLATEIVPSALALLRDLSPFWAVLFYFTLIVFGIAQQLAIWHCVITGIIAINSKRFKVWETTITFFACAFGFLLGLPLTTELGIFVVHFLDYSIGCGWCMMALYLMELGSVLVIRGRPYGGENVVTALFPSLRAEDTRQHNQPSCLAIWVAPTLAFAWNVMLPVALMVLSITVFKNGNFRSFYNWSEASKLGPSLRGFDNPYIHIRTEDMEHTITSTYWPVWTRKIGTFLQLIPLLIVPLTALIQTVRYLSSGSPDLFERMQALYRPNNSTLSQVSNCSEERNNVLRINSNDIPSENNNFEDPPPKYTPPPSYTAATGARIAKLLRQSFRRSMRRLTSALGEAGGSQGDVVVAEGGDGSRASRRLNRFSAPQASSDGPQLPPDYASVLVEIRQTTTQNSLLAGSSSTNESPLEEPIEYTSEMQREGSFIRGDNRISTATAESVATLLRSSRRRSKKLKSNAVESPSNTSTTMNRNSWRSSFGGSGCGASTNGRRASESVECLVKGTAPKESSDGEVNLGLEDLGSSSTAV